MYIYTKEWMEKMNTEKNKTPVVTEHAQGKISYFTLKGLKAYC